MRLIILSALSIVCSTMTAAELEKLELKDGRTLTGYYDDKIEEIILSGPGNVLMKVPKDSIVSRKAVKTPDKIEGESDEVAALRVQLKKTKLAALVAEAESAELRGFAASKDGDEAARLTSQAEAADALAKKHRATITELEAKLDELDPKEKPSALPSTRDLDSRTPDLNRQLDAYEKERDVLADKGMKIITTWLRSVDLEPLPVSKLDKDASDKEREENRKVQAENSRRRQLSGILKECERSGLRADQKNSLIDRVRKLTDKK